MAFPRLLVRAGSFAVSVPERIDNIFGLRNGGSMIAEATGNGSQNIISAALSGDAAQASQRAAAAPGGGTAAATEGVPSFSSLTFQQVRNFGGIFTYITSKWALACFTLVSLQIVIAALFTCVSILTSTRPSYSTGPISTHQYVSISVSHGQSDCFCEPRRF